MRRGTRRTLAELRGLRGEFQTAKDYADTVADPLQRVRALTRAGEIIKAMTELQLAYGNKARAALARLSRRSFRTKS